MKKALLETIYNLGAFAPFQLANREKILILTYHRFSRDTNPYKISSAEFAAHLEYLSKNNRVLPLSEMIEYLNSGKSLPPNTTAITIDDGYADAFEIAFPLLKKFKMPATVYAVTDFLDEKCWLWTDLMRYILLETKSETVKIEFGGEDKIESNLSGETQRLETASRINSRLKKLPNERKEAKIKEIAEALNVEIPSLPAKEFAPVSWQQAREMDAENVKIESHTATHPILTNISPDDLDFELKTSRKRLEEMLNREVRNFCYPNGSFNEHVQKSVEKAGYKSATTTDYGFNDRQANCFLLKRIDAQSNIANFAQSVSGFEAIKQKILN
ncbi:MAG: polysaccharide deacetylase family protein [Pyrinomonadaceae bacterium]